MNNFIYLIGAMSLSFGFLACNSNQETEGSRDPGAVTETDRQRYNLNSSDATLYDPLDTARRDSIDMDSSLNDDEN